MTRAATRNPTRAAWLLTLVAFVSVSVAVVATACLVRPDEASPDAGSPRIPSIPSDAFPMIVERVHDGDTLRARVREPNSIVTDRESTRVRLIGVDTPEISPGAECWGAEATASLTTLLAPGSTLWATADEEVLDRYGRHLLYLWTSDGTFINAELVARGDGEVMVFEPNARYEALFRELEAEASAAMLGQWGAC